MSAVILGVQARMKNAVGKSGKKRREEITLGSVAERKSETGRKCALKNKHLPEERKYENQKQERKKKCNTALDGDKGLLPFIHVLGQHHGAYRCRLIHENACESRSIIHTVTHTQLNAKNTGTENGGEKKNGCIPFFHMKLVQRNIPYNTRERKSLPWQDGYATMGQ